MILGRLGNYACVHDDQVGLGHPTVTETVTEVSTDYLIQTATESVTIYQTIVQTQHETDVQTIVQSITVLKTLVSITTNNAGQAVTQTLTISSVSVTAAPGQTGCSTSEIVSSKKSNNTRGYCWWCGRWLGYICSCGLVFIYGLEKRVV